MPELVRESFDHLRPQQVGASRKNYRIKFLIFIQFVLRFAVRDSLLQNHHFAEL